MDVITIFLFKIALVLIIGFIGALLARKLKLPNVSGFLVLGLLLGPSMGLIFKGFNGVITPSDGASLNFISQIALGFIAFSIGSEFSLRTVKRMGKTVSVITTTEVIGAVLVVFFALFFLPKPTTIMPNGYDPFSGKNIAFGLVLASMSAATAPAATLMVIRQYRAYGPVTKTILPVTALDDIFGIVVFGFFISIAQILAGSALEVPVWLVISKPFIEVFGSIFIGGVVGYLLSLLANKFDRIRDDLQILALTSVLLIMTGTEYLNYLLRDSGIVFSQLLANIMVGTMIANIAKNSNRTFTAINDFATPFYVIFFVLAGAGLDLAILGTNPLLLLISVVYIIARATGKILGVRVGAQMLDADENIKKYLGIALLPQGGISIGLLVIVYAQLNSLHAEISTIIMLSILVYETFGPVFAKYAITKAGEVGRLDELDEVSSVKNIELTEEN